MLKMILAMDKIGGIGYDNTLPWGKGYPEDLAYFKAQTMGQPVVMGRETFLSLKRREGLPNRKNIVISSQCIDCGENVLVMTYEGFLAYMEASPETIWCIGGAQLYLALFKYVKELHVTRIPGDYLSDTHLPVNFMWSRETVLTESIELPDSDAFVERIVYRD